MPRADKTTDKADFEADILSQLGEEIGGEKEEEDIEDETEESEEDDEEGEESDDDEEDEEEPEESDEEEPEIKVKSDKRGNLIDPKTGKIIAPAGAARRFYEDSVNAKKQLAGLRQQVQQRDNLLHQARDALVSLQGQVDGVNARSDLATELGLNAEEQAEFLHLASQFKDNNKAVDAIRYLLTKAVQRGIDIKSLGAGTAAFDPSVIVNDLSKKVEASLKPIKDRFAESEKQQEQRKAAEKEIQQFVLRNPDAQSQLPVIGEILKNPRFSHLGLDGAWLMLQNYLLRRESNRRQQSRTPVGRPAGGRARPGVEPSGGHIDDSPVSVDMEFRDILKGVIRDYGDIE